MKTEDNYYTCNSHVTFVITEKPGAPKAQKQNKNFSIQKKHQKRIQYLIKYIEREREREKNIKRGNKKHRQNNTLFT